MRDRTAVVFTSLALGFAVLYWIAVALSRSGALPFSMEKADFVRQSVAGTIVGFVLRDFGPAIAAVIALAVCRGRRALAALGRSIVQWRVPGRLYVLGWYGLLVNVAVIIAGYAAHALRFDPGAFQPLKFVLLFFVMIVLDGPLGEEIGWRGVLLPRLLERWSPLAAAAFVGVIWYAWHVPLYLVDGKLSTAAEHVFFLYTCIALSIIVTWFFLKSGSSTLLMIYLHATSNYATFLRFKLFPKIADSPAIIYAYCGALAVFAVLAAVKLSAARPAPDWRPRPESAAAPR